MTDLEEQVVVAAPTILGAAYIQNLFQFLRQTELHEPTNVIFDKCLRETMRVVESLLASPGQTGIELTFRREQIFVNKMRMRPKAQHFYIYRYILRFLRSRKLGAIRILEKPTDQQLLTFLWALAKIERSEADPAGAVTKFLEAQGIRMFQVESLLGANVDEKRSGDGLDDVELIVAILYERIRKFVEVCLDNMERASQFDLIPIQNTLNEIVVLAEEDIAQMLRLVSVKRYERPLPFRAANACFLMMAWARSLQLPTGVITELSGAALLHAIALLRETDVPASSDEATKRLPQIYADLRSLEKVWSFTDLQRLAATEWIYPFGPDGVYELQGTKCYAHFFSRMVRIVALFETMTTYEAGKRLFLPDEAVAELLRDPKNCDPTLLKLFVNWMGVYPVGSLVMLQSGEIGQVFAGASDPLRFQRPIISVLKDGTGKLLTRPMIVDLTEMNEKLGVYKRNIKRSVSIEEAAIPKEYFQMQPVGL